jgi:hypothetical protein
MKTTNHTPGPWYVTDIAIIGNNGGTLIAEHPAVKWQALKSVTKSGDAIVAESIKQAYANAHLIASAPDLLSAARNAANVLAALATGQLAEIKPDSNALQELRAAIAKAEGMK